MTWRNHFSHYRYNRPTDRLLSEKVLAAKVAATSCFGAPPFLIAAWPAASLEWVTLANGGAQLWCLRLTGHLQQPQRQTWWCGGRAGTGRAAHAGDPSSDAACTAWIGCDRHALSHPVLAANLLGQYCSQMQRHVGDLSPYMHASFGTFPSHVMPRESERSPARPLGCAPFTGLLVPDSLQHRRAPAPPSTI